MQLESKTSPFCDIAVNMKNRQTTGDKNFVFENLVFERWKETGNKQNTTENGKIPKD
jgi:hypothetical protein